MKKRLLFLTLTALVASGCSKTWSGLKQDTSEFLNDTQNVIHEATAPSYETAPITTPSYNREEVPASQMPVMQNNVNNMNEPTITVPTSNHTVTQVEPVQVSTVDSSTVSVPTAENTQRVRVVFEDKPTVTTN